MEIKNLWINKKAEVINKKAKVKLATFILAGTLALSMLTGCGRSKDNIFKGTILENTTVITFDDNSKDIAKITGLCISENSLYSHYRSITSGIYFSDIECEETYHNNYTDFLHHLNITKEENIVKYLTSDEIEKAYNGNLTDEDITEIITRITIGNEDILECSVAEQSSLKITRKK